MSLMQNRRCHMLKHNANATMRLLGKQNIMELGNLKKSSGEL